MQKKNIISAKGQRCTCPSSVLRCSRLVSTFPTCQGTRMTALNKTTQMTATRSLQGLRFIYSVWVLFKEGAFQKAF